MKIFIGLFFVAAVVVVAGILFLSPQTQGQQNKNDEPTIVKKGEVSQDEREYSKEYKKLYSDTMFRKLSELSDFGNSKGLTTETGTYIDKGSPYAIGNEPVLSPTEFLRDLACQADAVVLGSANKKTAHLTEDETFVYTDYELSVKAIPKNNSVSPFEVNQIIHITRPGGLIKLDNQVIRVEDRNYEPLELKKEYLLFLRYVPGANGYMMSDRDGDLILQGNSFKGLSRATLTEKLKSNVAPKIFLENLTEALSYGCPPNLKGGK